MKSSSVQLLRLAFSLAVAVSVSACVGASNTGADGTGGAGNGAAGSNGTAGNTGSTGGGQGGTPGGGQGGSTTGTGGKITGGGGTVVTGGGGRGTGGGQGQGGATGLGGATGNPDGGARPDLTGRKALFIVKSPSSLDDGDVLIQQLLELRGMTVTYGDVTTPPAMAASYNLMILSSGIGSDSSFAIFKDVPIPTIVYYNSLYQTMGFVATSSGRGTADDSIQVTMTDVSTQLSSDLANGSSFLMTNSALGSSSYGWAIPGGAAIKVAALVGTPTEFAVFAYEKGAAMGVGTAAGRRVALGWKSGVEKALTLQGFKLQDGAFSWTAGAP
jgi:hypothetical protein